VPCLEPTGPRTAILLRDGHEMLRWIFDDTRLLAPEPYAGRDLRTMMRWVRETFTDPCDYEAIVVLRRGVYISGSRTYDLDRMADAAATGHISGACYVFQPGVAAKALRVVGATRDFCAHPEQLLADLD
jgi:hypothetical protein